ncbi:MAG: serine/threonine-protein kinase [Bacteroidota bacterium]
MSERPNPEEDEAEAFFDRLMQGPLQLRAAADGAQDTLELQNAAGLNGIGPWTLGTRLGRGGMSHVYEATRNTPTGPQRAALKVARRASSKARTLFAREAELLTRLASPHVARVLDAGIHTDGRPYLALEPISGPTVTAAARHRSVRETVRLLLRACRAVATLHDAGIIHGDLKPEHLIVRDNGTVTVLDLGLAVDFASPPRATPDSTKSLTPEFAAPEQILGEPLHQATDVYALGLVLHEALYGRARRIPWGLGGNPAAPDRGSRPLRPQASANPAEQALDYALGPILQMALQPNPLLRYASATALATALTRALAPVSPGTTHA